MKEHPILMSAPMVRAILSGNKTQTRRVVKPQPPAGYRQWGRCINGNAAFTDHPLQGEKGNVINVKGPYGDVGDRLWVRESMHMDKDGVWLYSADDDSVGCDRADESAMISWAHHKESEHCPSIHMPRWASRITLEITGVRVERLQDIGEADAKAEGVAAWHDTANGTVYRPEFQMLWDRINSKRGYSWASNPWVWVVGFKKVSAA